MGEQRQQWTAGRAQQQPGSLEGLATRDVTRRKRDCQHTPLLLLRRLLDK